VLSKSVRSPRGRSCADIERKGRCTTRSPGIFCREGDPDARDRARTENIVAVSLFVVGGAALASGVAMLVLNQPRVVPADERPRSAVAPIVGRGTVGLSIAFAR
jgi:hypothetical protein